MTLSILAFIGLLIYGIMSGNFFALVSIHNSDGFRCNTDPTFRCKTYHMQMAICLSTISSRTLPA